MNQGTVLKSLQNCWSYITCDLLSDIFYTHIQLSEGNKKIQKQAVQGLEASAFCVVNVNSTVVFEHFERENS